MLTPPAPKWAPKLVGPQCDRDQIRRHVELLFPKGVTGFVNLRGIPEPPTRGDNTATNIFRVINSHIVDEVIAFADRCNRDGKAAFIVPAIMKGQDGGAAGVKQHTAIVADFDKGDPAANLKYACTFMGEPSLVIESGGKTAEGKLKLHAYWSIEPTDNLTETMSVRQVLVDRFGADPAFGRGKEAQPIRIAGSIHRKTNPALVQIHSASSRVIQLSKLDFSTLEAVPLVQPALGNILDFNGARTQNAMTHAEVRTGIVEREGKSGTTRFDAISEIIGAEIASMRRGLQDEDAARAIVRGWCAAHMEGAEDWYDRADKEFGRLLKLDIRKRGPLSGAAGSLDLSAWRAQRFEGRAPKRQWLVDGILPRGVAGIFAAAGDAGKTMLSLDLALTIGCRPAPQGIGDFALPKWFGKPVQTRGAAIVLTAEDDAAEVHRRLVALDPEGHRLAPEARLYVVPMPNAGGAQPILTGRNGEFQSTLFWSELVEQLRAIPDLALIVFDPLSTFCGVDINKDPQAGAAIMRLLGELATNTGATVLVTHHIGKSREITSLDHARDAIRGVTSLVDNGRFAIVLWATEARTAAGILKKTSDARSYRRGLVFSGGVVKSNAPHDGTEHSFVRNDATGLLVDLSDTIRRQSVSDLEIECDLLRMLNMPEFGIDAAYVTIGSRVTGIGARRNNTALLGLLTHSTRKDVTTHRLEAIAARLVEDGHLQPVEKPRGALYVTDLGLARMRELGLLGD